MKDLTLSELWIYPIKSLGGIPLTSAKVRPKGLLYDRRWMLVDESCAFMTQRTSPIMALFKLSIQGELLTITKKFSPPHLESSISFNIHAPALGQQIQTKIWDDVVDTIEVNQALSQWFTDHLNMNVKLVSFPEKNSRPVDPDYKVNDEHVSLADGFPFLIIGQSSLDDLNSRMEKPVPMNRFRPNLVFTGGAPYEEDGWRNFSIGKTRFVGVKPCSRCVLTTVNQDTGEKGIEPLYTLSTYRKQNNKVLFGQNAVALDDFEVSVGDKITLN